MDVRPPPPSGAPPAYSRMVKKVYPYNLRPVFLVTTLVGFIWSVVVGVEGIQDLSEWTNTNLDMTSSFLVDAKIKAIELVLAIMAFVVAGIELCAFVIGCMRFSVHDQNKLQFAKLLVWLAPVGLVVASVRELIVVIVHFVLKSTILDQCVVSESGDSIDDDENGVTYSAAQALDVCKSAYNRQSWSSIVWLIAVVCFSVLFTSVAMSYYRQLLDPSSVRQRVARYTEGAFQLQPQGPYAGGPAQGYQQPYGQPQYGYGPPDGPPGGYVPPYPGPPDANSPFAPRNDDITKASTGEFSLEAQEQAWRDATANGPTANLAYTPPAGAPSGHIAGQRGYDIGHNEEEDEAWARAREGGVTAHLTGGNDALRQGGGRV
ncbi:hypothetical protein QFC22_000031 [Naganishia vaughanmartiniae]|uniref:Uncharacterized protein n=1 Tax=Naganishia vaughanmartiniae TaxID=1424756 RepID=A0ACC2XM63_9TREE|nr:hypothetical protein QFC22_000031 [Naganishia vaughanmartiniae]